MVSAQGHSGCSLVSDDEARARFVQSACADNSDLLSEVWEYLEQDARVGSFLGGSNGPASDGSSRRFNLDALFQEYLQSASVSPTLIPQRFEQIERIGAGSFGDVYRVHDRARGQTVAIKVARLIKVL